MTAHPKKSQSEGSEYGELIKLSADFKNLKETVEEIRDDVKNLGVSYVTRDALALTIQKLEAASAVRATAVEGRVADLEDAAKKKYERDKFWVRLIVGGVLGTLIPELIAAIYFIFHARTQL